MTTRTYRLPLPPRGVGSNARSHWSRRARLTREYRQECAAAYLVQGIPAEPLERAHVEVEMRVCRKRVKEPGPWMPADEFRVWMQARDRYRPRDAGNVYDACKAALDALQAGDAGVVVSDDARHMELGAPRLVEVARFADEGVWVTVTPLLSPSAGLGVEDTPSDGGAAQCGDAGWAGETPGNNLVTVRTASGSAEGDRSTEGER